MHSRMPIKYPRSWTEARRIFKSLDVQWSNMKKHQDKRYRSREWIIIVGHLNHLYKMATEESMKVEKSLEAKREVYKSASIINKPYGFAAIMGTIVELNFHKKILRTTKLWMKTNRIPKK